jgi:hypothetical protein
MRGKLWAASQRQPDHALEIPARSNLYWFEECALYIDPASLLARNNGGARKPINGSRPPEDGRPLFWFNRLCLL